MVQRRCEEPPVVRNSDPAYENRRKLETLLDFIDIPNPEEYLTHEQTEEIRPCVVFMAERDKTKFIYQSEDRLINTY